jgi:hypothetical protein
MNAHALTLQLLAGPADSTPARIPLRFTPPAVPAPAYVALTEPLAADTPRARPRAFVYSDQYATRLTIHKWASWAMLPLVAGEVVVGQKLYTRPAGTEGGLRDLHSTLAGGIGALFAVNTVTGAWNLWEARKDPNDRTRRWIHGLTMLAADAGFLATAAAAPDDDCGEGGGVCPPNSRRAGTHRTLAITSASLATASWLMMLVWKH